MKTCFEVSFPITFINNDSFAIRFVSRSNKNMHFENGLYYLYGDNGVGKTTFVNLLALIAGDIGKGAKTGGTIRFNETAYNDDRFDHIKAAEIREKYFCILPQKAFFLPISTRDNYIVLNGSEDGKEGLFSSGQSPDLLSGGQQQKILMDILLNKSKPVWFLDEPLTNMDPERRLYFWLTLQDAYKTGPVTAFFIDHWMDRVIKRDKDFQYYDSLLVNMENRMGIAGNDSAPHEIEIFENKAPEDFFIRQMRKIKREISLKKKENTP